MALLNRFAHESNTAGTQVPDQPDEESFPSATREDALALLTDSTSSTDPSDLLEHVAIARSIAAAIRGTPVGEPIGIGLYGAWGQGKSTIGRLLRRELQAEISSETYAFVKIDAWKYAYEDTRLPRRRVGANPCSSRSAQADPLGAEPLPLLAFLPVPSRASVIHESAQASFFAGDELNSRLVRAGQ